MPPEWWDPSLYDFLSDLPVQGWIWEFTRRARLKEILANLPVDAMNPNPELEELDPDLWDLYDSYPTILRQNRHPVFFPPSVRISGKWPKGYRHQQFSVSDEDLRHIVSPDLLIDLNRPDSVIIRDFKFILLELKEGLPKPRRVSPRIREWLENRTLQIWDLRQFKVLWDEIPELVFDENVLWSVDKVKNAFKVTKKYIDENGWKHLARYVESE